MSLLFEHLSIIIEKDATGHLSYSIVSTDILLSEFRTGHHTCSVSLFK